MSALLDAPDIVAPAWLTVPRYTFTRGDEVIDLCEAVGWPCDPEQRMLLRAMFAGPVGVSFQTRHLQWASFEDTIICPRQNLKTSTFERAVLGSLWWLDARLILWSAHVFNPAAADTFKTFRDVIESSSELSRRVKRISEGSGTQGIELNDGAMLKFIARSKGGGRSLSADAVVGDEYYAASEADEGALLPTMAATPNPKLWRASSAGRIESAPLRRVRDRGRSGGPGQVYAEWAITRPCASESCTHAVDEPGCVLDDAEQWAVSNPAMVRGRIPESRIAGYRRAMSPDEFGREFAGWWDEPRAGSVIPMSRWVPLGRDPRTSRIDGPVCVAVDVTIDRKQSVVAVCGDAGGVPQVEIAAMADGTDWVVERVAAMIDRHSVVAVGARSAGPVASLLPGLRTVCDETQTEFVKIGSGDAAAQCGAFYDAVTSGSLAHLSDTRIDAALTAARKHQVLDAWQWSRTKVDVDAAPLVAVTGALALYAQHSKTTDYDPLSNIF